MILTTAAPTIAGTINPGAKAVEVAGEVVAAEVAGEVAAAEVAGEAASVAADLADQWASDLVDLLALEEDSADLWALEEDSADLWALEEDSAHVILSVDFVQAVLDVDSHLCPFHFVDRHASEDAVTAIVDAVTAIVDAVTAIVGAATVIVGVIVATIVVVVADLVMMKITTTDLDGPPKRMLNFYN